MDVSRELEEPPGNRMVETEKLSTTYDKQIVTSDIALRRLKVLLLLRLELFRGFFDRWNTRLLDVVPCPTVSGVLM